MPIRKVFEGSVSYMQILDKDGSVDKELEPALSKDLLEKIYYYMVLARTWDKKCLALQRTGRMYTYAPLEGQEAVIVGSGLAAAPEDWLLPTYRESFIYHVRGEGLERPTMEWMGWEEGLKLDKINCLPFVVPIGSEHPQGVGAAYALRMQGKKAAVIVFGGDGSSSQGDFHDAMNFAGVLDTPTVFLISNNQYAISVPRKWQTKSETIAQKALAYGFKGLQVDGNDVLAVYKSVKEAAEHARTKGPFLLEMITYRMGPHTTSDDPKKYRNEEEVAYWRERDPIKRFEIYLKGKGIWSEEYAKNVQEKAANVVEETVVKAEAFKSDPHDMFRYVFSKMTKNLEEQSRECFE